MIGATIGGVIGAAVMASAVAGAGMPRAEPEGNKYAKARLIAETTAAQPGQTLNLAVTFDISPGWHLYWKGQNDSGMPIEVELTLPEGFKAGEMRWPAPERYVLPGDLVDYVYHHRVTLIVPVSVPKDARGTLEAKAHVSFLVCEAACIPGRADVTLSVPIAAEGADAPAPSPYAKRFVDARRLWPRPLAEVGTAITRSWGTSHTQRMYELTFSAPGADRLAFMPEEGAAVLDDAITDGQKDGDALTLRFTRVTVGDNDARARGSRVRGILMRRQPGGVVDYIRIDEPLPDSADGAQPAKDTGTHAK